jgi:hypothetical protein
VPFAGWFSGSEMARGQYRFSCLGLVSLFGEVVIALRSCSTSSASLPTCSNCSSRWTSSPAGGDAPCGHPHIGLALLIGGSVGGFVRFSWAKLARYLAITGVLSRGGGGGVRLFHEHVLPHSYKKYESLVR